MRKTRKKMNIREFQPLTIVGRGAFGEVRICRQKSNGAIVAIKKMRKEEMLKKNQLMHVRTEKEIMTADNPWIVNLKYSFQDDYFLYLVMDYLPGGDLMNLLMKKDILTEDEARFYTAEMILAVDSVHKLNCIHRDLKPDNILIGKDGHIQLSDFGLAKIADKNFYPLSAKDEDTKCQNDAHDTITTHKPAFSSNTSLNTNKGNRFNKKRTRLTAFSTVGTPDYIAPEVFGKEGYGPEVDWWSIGVMLFEMVVGYPPFFSEQPTDTCKKVVKWRQHFSFPPDANLSYEAQDLITRFVTNADNRLGRNGVEEIKRHPFFRGVDWDNIRKTKAPFIPQLVNEVDSKYFDQFKEEEPFYPPEIPVKNKKRKDINYAGYTFNRDVDNMNNNFVHALEVLEVVKRQNEQEDNDDEKEVIIDEGSSNIPGVLPVGTNVNNNNSHHHTNNNNNGLQNKNNSFSNINHSHSDEDKINAMISKEKPQTAGIQYQHQYETNNKKGGDVSSAKQNQKNIPINKAAPFKGANKIMISNDTSKFTHKKISKSPEIKSKEKINSGIANIPIKTQRDGSNRISPGKIAGNPKGSVLSKLKLNSGFGLLSRKNHANYLNTYSENTMSSGFSIRGGSNTIAANKKK